MGTNRTKTTRIMVTRSKEATTIPIASPLAGRLNLNTSEVEVETPITRLTEGKCIVKAITNLGNLVLKSSTSTDLQSREVRM